MLSLALVILAQTSAPDDWIRPPRLERVQRAGGRSGPSYAFLEFAPASGAGMGAACACTTPTGAKGEALTYTRTGTAMCSKQGSATTGITNADLVSCAADKPRIELEGGLLSYLREESRQNSITRSQELQNLAWPTASLGVAAPVVTADQAVAPDGTTTAEQVDLPAISSGYSVLYQGATGTVAAWSASCYAKGVSGSGSFYLMLTPGGTYTSALCSYTSTSWTRCSVTATETVATWYLQIGIDLRDGAQTSKPAQSVYLWGCQFELGDWPSSYIPTTAAAASRTADPAITATLATAVGPSFSIGASAAYLSSTITTATALQLGTAAPNLASVGRSTNTAAAYTINATSTTPAVSAMGTSMLRASLNDASGTRSAFFAGSSVAAPAASMSATATPVSLGALNSRTARVCIDPSPSRCN